MVYRLLLQPAFFLPASYLPNLVNSELRWLSTFAKVPQDLKCIQTKKKQNTWIPVRVAHTNRMKRERPAAGRSCFLPVCQVKCWSMVWGAPWARASSWRLDFSHGLAGVVQRSDPVGLTSQTCQSSRTSRITRDLQTMNLLQRMNPMQLPVCRSAKVLMHWSHSSTANGSSQHTFFYFATSF